MKFPIFAALTAALSILSLTATAQAKPMKPGMGVKHHSLAMRRGRGGRMPGARTF